MFYIKKGKVKKTVLSEQGKEAVVAILGPDEFCGEARLTRRVLRLATAAAMTECEIIRFEKAAKGLSSANPRQKFAMCSILTGAGKGWR